MVSPQEPNKGWVFTTFYGNKQIGVHVFDETYNLGHMTFDKTPPKTTPMNYIVDHINECDDGFYVVKCEDHSMPTPRYVLLRLHGSQLYQYETGDPTVLDLEDELK